MRAGADEAPVLRNLLQLYLYDVAEFEPTAMGPDGLFEYRDLDRYWHEPGHVPFLASFSGRPAGFALVSEHSVLDPNAAGIRTVSDFFVTRAQRRLRLGTHLALEVFRRLPGRWEVRVPAANLPAQAFWRKVIAEYTAGRFVELELDDQRWRGPIQTFDNSLMLG